MKKYFLLIPAAMLLLLISCNSEGIGIFYKISVEPPLSTSELSEKRIYKIVSDGTDTYVLAGGAIYKKNGSVWDKITAPSGEIQAVSLASDGTNVYSVYAGDINSSLYQLVYGATSWSIAADTQINNSNDLLLVDGDNSFIFVTQEIAFGQYDIWSYDNTSLVKVSATAIDTPVIDGTILGVTYYLASSNVTDLIGDSEIYTTDGNIGSLTATSPSGGGTSTFPFSKALGGIIIDPVVTPTLYVSTKDGFIYGSDDGDTWTLINATALINSFGNTAKLGPMAITDITSDYLVIGSDTGYFEMLLPSGTPVTPSATLSIDTVYEAVDLYHDMVFTILADGLNKFYIGTENGLWYNNTTTGLDLK